MVATIRPEAAFLDETLSTLRYAASAKSVVNHAVVNENPLHRKIKELEATILALKAELNAANVPPGEGGGGYCESCSCVSCKAAHWGGVDELGSSGEESGVIAASMHLEGSRSSLDPFCDVGKSGSEHEEEKDRAPDINEVLAMISLSLDLGLRRHREAVTRTMASSALSRKPVGLGGWHRSARQRSETTPSKTEESSIHDQEVRFVGGSRVVLSPPSHAGDIEGVGTLSPVVLPPVATVEDAQDAEEVADGTGDGGIRLEEPSFPTPTEEESQLTLSDVSGTRSSDSRAPSIAHAAGSWDSERTGPFSGFLLKRGKLNKTWKRRWFLLKVQNASISYF